MDAHTEHPLKGRSRDAQAYLAVQSSERFVALRRRNRRFVFTASALVLLWWMAVVLLAGWAPEFFAVKVFGYVNVGLLFGLAQLLTLFVTTAVYLRFAARRIDPEAAQLRNDLERARS